MNNLTFGRYTPYNTFVHKMDARNKLFLTIAFIVVIFFRFSNWGSIVVFTTGYILLLALLMIVSKTSFIGFLRGLKGMWLLALFLFILYIFIPNSNYTMAVAFKVGDMKVRWDAFFYSGYIIIRLMMIMGLMMILTSTTSPMNLTYAFEWHLSPLKVIKFPVHETAMILSIALRFIPTILEETDRIMKAQSSRGVDFNHGGLFKRFRALTSLIIPLFISAIERSDELANAMEARGYDPKNKRTRYRKLKFSCVDLFSFIFIVGVVSGTIYFYVYDKNVAHIDLFSLWFKIQIK